jgi:hypothetical protein
LSLRCTALYAVDGSAPEQVQTGAKELALTKPHGQSAHSIVDPLEQLGCKTPSQNYSDSSHQLLDTSSYLK